MYFVLPRTGSSPKYETINQTIVYKFMKYMRFVVLSEKIKLDLLLCLYRCNQHPLPFQIYLMSRMQGISSMNIPV